MAGGVATVTKQRPDSFPNLLANGSVVQDGTPLPVHEVATGTPVVTRGQATQADAVLIPADPNRAFAEIRNLDAANNIEVSGAAGVAFGAGYPIMPGETFQYYGTAALSGICAATKTANFALIDIPRN